MIIDFHLHTTASDGQYTPSEIVYLAHKLGIEKIAITDHDTLNGLDEAIYAASQYSVEILQGIELGASEHKYLHILGLGLKEKSEQLISMCNKLEKSRNERKYRIINYLNEKGIELVIKGEKPLVSTKSEEDNIETEDKAFYEKPKYVGKNGECYFEKPEYMTVVDGNVLISKNSKLIALRGKIETFLAEVLLTGKEIELTSNNDKLIRDIETVIKFVQNIMVAEKLNKILENQTFFDSKSIKDIKEIIENPKQYFKKGHLLEISLNSDLTIHRLNRLRFLARELEIQAIDYFVEDYKVSRKDLLEAFNILSDVIYIIILKVDNGEYR